MDTGAPHNNVYSIAAGTAFVDALASGILDRFGGDPAGLADIRILLPTRRACRALGEAFLRATDGRPALLPTMTPIGDIDEDEIGFLASEERMIMAQDATMSAAHAARLANELGRLIDEVRTERLDFADLEKIVPERFSQHWQETLVFLQIVTEHWPAILAEHGCLDAADRRPRTCWPVSPGWKQDC